MIRVAPGHYRDTFRKHVFDVEKGEHFWYYSLKTPEFGKFAWTGYSDGYPTKMAAASAARIAIVNFEKELSK